MRKRLKLQNINNSVNNLKVRYVATAQIQRVEQCVEKRGDSTYCQKKTRAKEKM